ncbi:5-formyltetrahydrofolate cyclo-ligase [Lentilactobacillus senioris]|uniref:5-formyltetrahydrofolate cyclo-ligase n=1 Tax=Lentilactobacillus senioris TaxID=931534 RepID=UPI0022820599|nr:5-formyltetrahydrofolate cyclo-ligase [Lentilactobacillus senioris]MCY9806928.1 5-formyltetrahydrofolate cyclo-ligase [Lentilactobacillus senioris]
MVNKKELRKTQEDQLAAYFQTTNAVTDSLNLYQQLQSLPVFQEANVIATTLNMPGELDTLPIINMARLLGKQVVIPKTLPKLQMEFYQMDDELTLEKTKFGVVEPKTGTVVLKKQIDLIVVPGLAFTQTGIRVGFGAGFYDRYLADYQGNTVSLALPPQYFKQPLWPVEEFDVKVDQVLTPGGVVSENN